MEEVIYFDDDGCELGVLVKVMSYTPYRSGRVGHPDNWEPDEQEELELQFTLITGGEYEPTEEEYEQAYRTMLDLIRS